jgi:branched-chain amino acid transport system ATP-binding protein
VLTIEGLTVAYGGLLALHDVSIAVGEGELVAIVGPNGAGKTTLFKTLSGVVAARSGTIRFDGTDLLAVPPAARAALGIAHVPEGRQVFKSLSVLANLEMGAYPDQAGRRQWPALLDELLGLFPILAQRRHQLAGTLSGGEQQMLAIARGLASRPRLLLLDEPSMGLAPKIADEIFERIVEIHRERRMTTILVEQRVVEALDSCDRGYVLETGRVALSGGKDALLGDPEVRRAYLGL